MGDHFHGLCKSCLTKCSHVVECSKNQNQCEMCEKAEPELICEDDGRQLAVCLKCYLRKYSSPSKTETKSHAKEHSSGSTYSPIRKSGVTRSLFSKEGKMLGRVQKYFEKFQGKLEDLVRQVHKKSIIPAPLNWQAIIKNCHKVGSLMFIFGNEEYLVGFYQLQAIRLTAEKASASDPESGFFLAQKPKGQLQVFKANNALITYHCKKKAVELGNPVCFEMIFEGKMAKVNCEVLRSGLTWPLQAIVKL